MNAYARLRARPARPAAVDDDTADVQPDNQPPFFGAFALAPPSPMPPSSSATATSVTIPAVTLKGPHPFIISEPTLHALGFRSSLTASDSSLTCPNGTRLPLHRDTFNRPYLTAHVIYSPESPPALGLGFSPGSGPPVDLLLDTCGGITALDHIHFPLIRNRSGTRNLVVVSNLVVPCLDSGTLHLH